VKSDQSQIGNDWYRAGFDVWYPIVYAHRTVAAAAPEAAFAAERLALGETDRVLDLCCGNGRHMVHLIPVVRQVVGLDYSAAMLRLAKAAAPGRMRLVRADMRSLPFDEAFDVVVNFFTSFGYFASHAENLRVIAEVARVLKPGGRFFIDYLNPVAVQRTLVPESVREYNGYTIRERRWIDHEQRRVNKTVVVSKASAQVSEWGESVRLYEEAELREMLAVNALHVAGVFGDYDGTRLDEAQPRMILVGSKG